MATIQSLVENKTLIVDGSVFASTGDKVFINGHFYSDKPPAPALLGAIAYAPLYILGFELHEGNSASYFLITLLTVALSWVAGTLAFFHSLKFASVEPQHRLLASLALGFGTIFFSWSTTFNNHELAASFLSIGFCFLLKARFEQQKRRNLCYAGFFLSLAGACDIPTLVFYSCFLLYVLRWPVLRKQVVFYLFPVIATVAPTLAINYTIHHSVMPVQIVRAYFEYPGSPWIGSNQLSGMSLNDAAFAFRYAAETLFGARGFLLYNPFIIVSTVGLAWTIGCRRNFFCEGICIAVGSFALAIYYWLTTTNFGDWSYSIRWFVPLIPLLLFFLYPFFQPFGHWRQRFFMAILCVSVAIAVVGAFNPWSPMTYSNVPFVANIKQFISHFHHHGSNPRRASLQ